LKNRKSALIGFALETGNNIAQAKKKLKEKKLDLIVLNNANEKGAGFDVDTNVVTIISKSGKVERLKKMTKYAVAHEILNRSVKFLT
jgi:phosphopantothenoylcysteine decarboxylase/phosphopantothenate--cysteine ligase